jgi:hypothetical protein
LLSVQHESDDDPVSFQHFSNWHDICLSNCESAEDRSPNRQGEIQVAITFDSVREIFKGLENGAGAAFFERVRQATRLNTPEDNPKMHDSSHCDEIWRNKPSANTRTLSIFRVADFSPDYEQIFTVAWVTIPGF